jgi:Icc-related predicted phosphoesterase
VTKISIRLWGAIPYIRTVAIILTVLLGSLLSVYLFGPTSYDIQGASVYVFAEPAAEGKTVVDIPPFGNILANTHPLPLELHLRLDYVGTQLAQGIVNLNDTDLQIITTVQKGLQDAMASFFWRQIAVGALGAALFTLLLWRLKIKHALLAGLAGALIIALILLGGFRDYDIEAFKEPEYTGVIAMAPQFIPEPSKLLAQLEEMKHQTRLMVFNMQSLFDSVKSLSLLGNPEKDESVTKILLVSDLHSNPVGISFINGLAQNFDIDLIIDAGDLTDFGSPLETKVTDGLKELKIPYLFCPGNHDTPEISNFVRSINNTWVLDRDIIEVAGIRIMGVPDPLSTGSQVTEPDEQKWGDLAQEQMQYLITYAQEAKEMPDLLVVHNPQLTAEFTDCFPIIINGHTHSQQIRQTTNSIILNPGTSGAAGMRGLYTEDSVPYSAIILYYKPSAGALAADTINYEPQSDRFYIERKLFNSLD